jgi:RNA polymerase sigma factor (sigma-70 family)
MMSAESYLIKDCIHGKQKAQLVLFEKYSPLLKGICNRYIADKTEAKDIFQEGFVKIITNLRKFNHEGSFEGWMKRIMVNTAISHLRKKQLLKVQINYETMLLEKSEDEDDSFIDNMLKEVEFSQEELIQIVNDLPTELRVVFNLYTIEEFQHKEIAEILDITEIYSKVRLLRARKILQQKIMDIYNSKMELVSNKVLK